MIEAASIVLGFAPILTWAVSTVRLIKNRIGKKYFRFIAIDLGFAAIFTLKLRYIYG